MVSADTSLPLSPVEIPEQPRKAEREKTNVGELERVVSVMGGSMLVASGIRRLSLPGLIMAGVGWAMIHRGSTGQCAVYKKLGVTTAKESMVRRAVSNPLNVSIRVEQSVVVNKPVG